jgi:hypothetical protein
MPLVTGGSAGYAPPATVLAGIKAYRDRGLTTPITAEVLIRASIPETLAGRTLRSMESLDLIDKEGKPTPEFEVLKRVPTAEFKPKLEALVRSVYADVFQFTDPATDTPEKVTDAFRAYVPDGQRSRMVTLFLGLCEAAGIVPEGSTAKRMVTATARTGSQPKRNGAAGASRGPSTGGPAGTRIQHGGGQHIMMGANGSVSPALIGLLGSIPAQGWTQADRDKFMTAFGHVLDFTVPIRTSMAAADDDE